MDISDIEGSKPKPEKFFNKPNLNDIKDINQEWEFQTKRTTNPLEPNYQTRDEEGNLVTIGNIEGAKPRLQHEVKEPYIRSLHTGDIAGASAGSLLSRYSNRKDARETNAT